MEPVDGFNATVAAELPVLHASDPRLRNRMGFALVEGALSLGKVDYLKAGLADFGKPEGFIERQAPRGVRSLRVIRSMRDGTGVKISLVSMRSRIGSLTIDRPPSRPA
jgi:hypothetical protein